MLIGLYVLAVSVVLIISLPNRLAACVFLVTAMFVPMGANMAVAGINLYPMRMLVLAALVQLALHGQLRPPPLSKPDKMMVIFIVLCLWSSLFHKEVQQAFVYRAGISLDMLGSYYVFRCWIKEWSDLSVLFRTWFLCIVALVAFMTIEQLTGHNIFAMVGGLPLFSDIREGRLRARGPFRHPILAGTAGAVFLPFAIALCRWKPMIGVVGIIAGIAVVIYSASSGPVGSLVAVVIGVGLWRFRERLGLILKACLAVLLFLLLFVLYALVLYLIARAGSVGSIT